MKPASTTNDEQLRWERIAAYLDGELSPVEQALVERQLAEDPEFRREVRGIERAWEALDALPDTEVDGRFAQTTMELVVDVARQELAEQTRALPRLRRQRSLGQVLSLVAAGLLGLLVVRLVQQNPNRALVAELPAIKYLDAYGQFTDVAFLRLLQQRLGKTPWSVEFPPEELQQRTAEFDAVSQPEERRDWLAALDDDQRAALRGRYNRFLALSASDQGRLHDLHDSVAGAGDRAQLVDTLLHYQQWLSTLSASEQYKLRQMSTGRQVEEIVRVQQREANVKWIELTPDEVQHLRVALMELRKQMVDDLPPEERRNMAGGSRRDRLMFLAQQFPDQRQRWVTAVLAALPSEKQAQFRALSVPDQQQQLRRWIMESMQPGQGYPGQRRRDQVSQEELEEFFTQLDPTKMERLLAQPAENFDLLLRRWYWGGGFPDEGMPFDQPGPRGPHNGPGSFGGPGRGPGPRGPQWGFGPQPPFGEGPPPPEENGPPPGE